MKRLRSAVAIAAFSAFLMTAGSAYALPSNGGGPGGDTGGDPGGGRPEPCIKPTQVDPPELRTQLSTGLPNKAALGQTVQIAAQSPTIFVPSTRCEGQGTEVPVTSFAWGVTERPGGSTADAVKNPVGFGAAVTPDLAGKYTVTFTACPNTCTLAGNRKLEPTTREISFNAVAAKQTKLTSDEFQTLVEVGLRDTRLQISHTNNGVPVYGPPYTVKYSIPSYKYQQLTNCDRLTGQAAERCEQRAERITRTGTNKLRTVVPKYNSYIDFGGAAEYFGAPKFLPLSIDPVEKDVPLWLRGVIMGLSPGGFLASVDIDKIKLYMNNINTVIGPTTFKTNIANGKFNMNTTLDSSRPAVICEGHYKVKAGYFLTVTSGWADSMCPDFDVEPIKADITMVPVVNAAGELSLGQPNANVRLNPRGVQSNLIQLLVDATGTAAARAKKSLERGLENSAARPLGKTVEAIIKKVRGIDDLGPILSAKIVGNELLVTYEPVKPAQQVMAGGGQNQPVLSRAR
jgi:hypothetical protein